MAAVIHAPNEQFGHWTVVKQHTATTAGLMWWVRCVCGAERAVKGYSLRNGDSKSCGCRGIVDRGIERTRRLAKTRSAKRRADNPEAYRIAHREWVKNNRDKVREHSKRSRLKHPEKVRRRQQRWREENRERLVVESREYYKTRKDEFRDKNLRKNFGITLVAFNEMLERQGGGCAICGGGPGATGRTFAVDHCHDTGAVRGLLCRGCNLGLGHLQDNAELLDKAAAYLRADP